MPPPAGAHANPHRRSFFSAKPTFFPRSGFFFGEADFFISFIPPNPHPPKPILYSVYSIYSIYSVYSVYSVYSIYSIYILYPPQKTTNRPFWA